MYTVEILMNMATEAEKEYLRLREKFPPGTYHKDRNDKYTEMQNALHCAAWMEKRGITEIENIGPFTSTLIRMINKKDRVKIKRGSIVHSTHPSIPREGVVTTKVQTITVFSIDKGYVNESDKGDEVKNGSVHWVGAGGYWKWCSVNDILVK